MSASALLNREDYLAVEGWLNSNVLYLLDAWQEYYQSRTVSPWSSTLEIGVHHGRMFLALESITPPSSSCFAVDVFEDQGKNIDKSGKGNSEVFQSNIARLASHPERVVPVQLDSFSIKNAQVLPHRYSLISIDGGHTREHTAHDLAYADQTLDPGGLIALDDISNPSWLGVVEGALDFLATAGRRIAPFMIGFNKLFLTTITECTEARVSMEKSIAANRPHLKLQPITKLRGHDVRPVVTRQP